MAVGFALLQGAALFHAGGVGHLAQVALPVAVKVASMRNLAHRPLVHFWNMWRLCRLVGRLVEVGDDHDAPGVVFHQHLIPGWKLLVPVEGGEGVGALRGGRPAVPHLHLAAAALRVREVGQGW